MILSSAAVVEIEIQESRSAAMRIRKRLGMILGPPVCGGEGNNLAKKTRGPYGSVLLQGMNITFNQLICHEKTTMVGTHLYGSDRHPEKIAHHVLQMLDRVAFLDDIAIGGIGLHL